MLDAETVLLLIVVGELAPLLRDCPILFTVRSCRCLL